MAYDLTWDDDAPNYNAHTVRSFTKIDDELEKLWLDSPNFKNSRANEAPSRSLGTTYTNGSDIRVVNATIECNPNAGLSAERSGVNATVNGNTVGRVEQQVGTLQSTTTCEYSMMFVVGPNEDYAINIDNSTDAPTITYWIEYDFDGVYSADAWQKGDTLTASKLNDYAKAANGTIRTDEVPDIVNDTTATEDVNNSLSVDGYALVSAYISIASGDEMSFILDTTFPADKISNDTNDIEGDMTALVNRDGEFEANIVSGSPTFNESWEIGLSTPTNILFNSSDQGTTVGNKLRNLDSNASQGAIQTDLTTTRTFPSITSGERTPSTSNISFVSAVVELQPTTLNDASANLRVGAADGNNDFRSRVRHAAGGSRESQRTLTTLLGPGESWTVQTSNAVILNKIEVVIS